MLFVKQFIVFSHVTAVHVLFHVGTKHCSNMAADTGHSIELQQSVIFATTISITSISKKNKDMWTNCMLWALAIHDESVQ